MSHWAEIQTVIKDMYCLKETLKEPKELEPLVRFWEFGESSLNFILIIWLDDLAERFAVRNDINFEIDKMFKQEKVEIPFPQRVVHMRNE